MNANFFRNFALAASVVLTVSACGGGGDTTASGGTGGTGVSFGAVTDFGSIFVNGVEFSTSGATITRDDNSIPETELRKGMVVEVRGSIASSTSGTATTVEVEEAVRGPLEATPTGTPSTGGKLFVLGQEVHVDNTTLIDNTLPAFGSILAGTLLEVHGQRRPDGSIAATFIERKTGPVVFAVRGTVAGHSSLAQTFAVGALTVSYGAGTVIGDMPVPSGNNWNDLFIEVKGTICAGVFPVCGTLTATKVEPDRLGLADAAQAEVEGFVTTFTSTSNFKIGAQQVLTTGSTMFLGGDQIEIAQGVKLEVEGSLAGGVLTATKVKFKDSVKIESNATASGATITAVAGLPGITVTANAFTQFKNTAATATNLAPLNLRSVRIRGRASGANSVIATEIEDRGPADNSDVRLQGFATAVSNPTFVILGVQVNTSVLPNPAGFKGVDDTAIGSAAFYSAITPSGGLVKARGNMPAPAANALDSTNLKEVELED
ncbi:MAG: DUF5666 domain-containing protein [Betaproteobacteria bacterium]|nr:DUF5666 domain-containing protein [Betaproteobacteria bacterium]MDH5577058.1 DUF5666 domain-containing protein [Betaproteobacteria bacterium]